MAPSKPCPINGFKLAVLAMALFFSITSTSSPKSVHGVLLYPSHSGFLQERKLLILGSRPPGCVNKCSNCRPCMAALVVPSHQSEDSHTKKPSSSHESPSSLDQEQTAATAQNEEGGDYAG